MTDKLEFEISPEGKGHYAQIGALGTAMVQFERRRQIEEEGYTAEHDDGHETVELIDAAKSYLYAAEVAIHTDGKCMAMVPPNLWPWEPESFKPSPDPEVNFAKAGALAAAAIDRYRRGQLEEKAEQ